MARAAWCCRRSLHTAEASRAVSCWQCCLKLCQGRHSAASDCDGSRRVRQHTSGGRGCTGLTPSSIRGCSQGQGCVCLRCTVCHPSVGQPPPPPPMVQYNSWGCVPSHGSDQVAADPGRCYTRALCKQVCRSCCCPCVHGMLRARQCVACWHGVASSQQNRHKCQDQRGHIQPITVGARMSSRSHVFTSGWPVGCNHVTWRCRGSLQQQVACKQVVLLQLRDVAFKILTHNR
jgi:hypothetical protein